MQSSTIRSTRHRFLIAMMSTVFFGAFATLPALAEEDVVSSTDKVNPAEYDRDGKHICGYELMSESERGGHRSQLHFTKSLEDRDAIRKDLCDRMRKRAQDQGVPFKE